MGSTGGEALSEPDASVPLLDRPRAAPWRRALARAIDLATVATILWILVVLQILWFMDELSERVDPEPWGRWFVATMFFGVVFGVYEVIFLVRSKGQTPGKDIMKLRVIPHEGGEQVTWWRALRRCVAPGFVVVVHPVWWAVAGMAALGAPALTAPRRSVPDLLAGTVVVPYDRDREDPSAKRPMSRRARRLARQTADEEDDG